MCSKAPHRISYRRPWRYFDRVRLVTVLLLSLLGLALLDSINPSALVVTIYLLLRGKPFVSKTLVYVGAVFTTYLTLGALIMAGLGRVWDYFDGPVAHGAQGVLGAALLAFAFLAPKEPRRGAQRRPTDGGLVAVFLLGVTITVVEFSTAFPYLGAIALMTNADLFFSQWLPLLAAYNLIFVLPPLALLAAYLAFGDRLRAPLEKLKTRFAGGSRETMLWISGIVGFLLLRDALAFFDFFGLLNG